VKPLHAFRVLLDHQDRPVAPDTSRNVEVGVVEALGEMVEVHIGLVVQLQGCEHSRLGSCPFGAVEQARSRLSPTPRVDHEDVASSKRPVQCLEHAHHIGPPVNYS